MGDSARRLARKACVAKGAVASKELIHIYLSGYIELRGNSVTRIFGRGNCGANVSCSLRRIESRGRGQKRGWWWWTIVESQPERVARKKHSLPPPLRLALLLYSRTVRLDWTTQWEQRRVSADALSHFARDPLSSLLPLIHIYSSLLSRNDKFTPYKSPGQNVNRASITPPPFSCTLAH